YMHIKPKENSLTSYSSVKYNIKEEEVQRVFNMISGQNQNKKKQYTKPKKKVDFSYERVKVEEKLPECLIVDGYNQLYGWNSLKDDVKENISYARDTLISLLQNYQGYKNIKVMIVFDAYRIKDTHSRNSKSGDTEVIYTKYGQTADSYIEKLVHDLKGKYKITVATSDGLIQNSILASGASRMSARELEMRVRNVNKQAFQALREN
ncbi:MAG: NYN domain-containing protein, partial [Floccifex sp.]